MTNKTESVKSVVLFHNGRGSQEGIFGDTKNDAALNVVPSKRLAGNQLFTLCAMMAHNLSLGGRCKCWQHAVLRHVHSQNARPLGHLKN